MVAPWNDIYLSHLIDDGKETIGYLHYSSGFDSIALNTLELPWLNNMKDVSRITDGVFPWVKYLSPTKGWVILIKDVPGRTNIEIHIANFVDELLGCIAVGIGMGDIDGDGLIDMKKSKEALESLLAILPEKGFIHIDSTREIRKKYDKSGQI